MYRSLLDVLLVATLIGCNHGGIPTGPSLADNQPVPPVVAMDGNQLLIGTFRLHVDVAASTATITPPRRGSAQPPQALSYDLDIDKFLTEDTLKVANVDRDAFGNVILTIRHAHPFPAPDFTQGISAHNRADLGYTGRLLILAHSQTVVFAGGGLQFDPTLVRNPAGYAYIGDLLHGATGSGITVYPFVLLADEDTDNREGITNGGVATGNYAPASGGWQRANAGTATKANGWTGYDFVHQGQAVDTTIVLDRATLTAGAADVDLAILIKYTDPRGAGGRPDRFPLEPVDVTQFAYRLPFAALDVETCRGCQSAQIEDPPNATRVQVAIRDWDTGAAESTDANLSDEPNVARVQPGAGAAPVVEGISDLFTAPIPFTKVSGTGLAGDEFIYAATLNNIDAKPEGSYWMVVTATDAEDTDPARDTYHFGVDPSTLVADAGRRLRPASYLPMQIEVTHGSSWIRTWGLDTSTFVNDVDENPTGDLLITGNYFEGRADLEPGACEARVPSDNRGGVYLASLDTAGNYRNSVSWDGAMEETDGLTTVDADGNIYTGFTTGNTRSVAASMPTIDLDPGAGVDLHSDPWTDVALVKLNAAGQFQWGKTWGNVQGYCVPGDCHYPVVEISDIAVDDAGNVFASGTWFYNELDDDPGPGTHLVPIQSDTYNDFFIVAFDAAGNHLWSWSTGSSKYDFIESTAITPSGNLLAVGEFQGTIDFDPGAGTHPLSAGGYGSIFRVELTPGGNFVAADAWCTAATPGEGRAVSVAFDHQGREVIGGYFSGTQDLDPGPGTDLITPPDYFDFFITRFEASGAYEWTRVFDLTDALYLSTDLQFRIAPDDGLLFAGQLEDGSLDLDPGPGTAIITSPPSGHSYFWTNLDSDGLFTGKQVVTGSISQPIFQLTSSGRMLVAGHTYTTIDLDPSAAMHTVVPESFSGTPFLSLLQPDGSW
ncbi:MAG: hypothetical protein ABI743_07870 [bacterium]